MGLLAQSCLVVHRAELPLPSEVPAPAPSAVLEFEVGEIRLLHGDGPAQSPVGYEQTLGSEQLSTVLEHWMRRGRIGGWGKAGRLAGHATHRLRISGIYREDDSRRWIAASAASLAWIPSRVRARYEWTFTLQHLQTQQSYDVPVARTQITWLFMPLLPLSPLSLLGSLGGLRYQADYLYTELAQRGAWTSQESSP